MKNRERKKKRRERGREVVGEPGWARWPTRQRRRPGEPTGGIQRARKEVVVVRLMVVMMLVVLSRS